MSKFVAPVKNPSSVLDYLVDWTYWLDTDTITSYGVVANGVDIKSHSINDNAVKIWATGGVNNTIATISITINTYLGRTDKRTISIKIRET